MTNLQSDVTVGAVGIYGSLKYVTGYTGFSGDTNLQSGHFLALHCEAGSETADRITVGLINGDYPAVELDEDGIVILRIRDKDAQAVNVTVYDGGKATSKIYDLSGLVLEAAE